MIAPDIIADGMFPKAFTKTGFPKHHRKCKGAFGRYDWRCHRCCELMRGAASRESWQDNYFSRKLGDVQRSFNF